jgi:KaiC/GvpD/RAD55 family RecA-like ATPase
MRSAVVPCLARAKPVGIAMPDELSDKLNNTIDIEPSLDGSPAGACGGYARSVDAAMDLYRVLWDLAVPPRLNLDPGIAPHSVLRPFPVCRADLEAGFDRLRRAFDEDPLPDFVGRVIHHLSRPAMVAAPAAYAWCEEREGVVFFGRSCFEAFSFLGAVLPRDRPAHERQYFVMRNIRRRYRLPMASETARLFYLLSNTLNRLAPERHRCSYRKVLLPMLTDAVRVAGLGDEPPLFFVECCLLLGYLRTSYHWRSGEVEMRARVADAEFMLSNLFGMPTGIQGFDMLFGGGGLMLAERAPSFSRGARDRGKAPGASRSPSPDRDATELDGRVVLVQGQPGTGKSILALQLAAEVARKGGLAWLMPLEQKPAECLYTLESIGIDLHSTSVFVATNICDARKALDEPRNGCGAIILLRTVKDDYLDFLDYFEHNAGQMSNYPLRLIGVDPINSIERRACDPTELRTRTVEVLGRIKQSGTNVLLLSEDEDDGQRVFEAKIADTVINLSIEKGQQYAQRYIQVLKSRQQREQRGKHPFSIAPGRGIMIVPSSASVGTRLRTRSVRARFEGVDFGLTELDRVLNAPGDRPRAAQAPRRRGQRNQGQVSKQGPEGGGPARSELESRGGAIPRGGVVVVQGPNGTFRTPLGLLFLCGYDDPRESSRIALSLFVSGRYDEPTVRQQLRNVYVPQPAGGARLKPERNIRVITMPHGYVQPGLILQRIEEHLDAARIAGTPVDRAVVDGVEYWEATNPFVRADQTFGDTLVDVLRRNGVTSLFICGEPGPGGFGGVQRPIVERADCLIQLERFGFRGADRVKLRIRKTSDMRHRHETFELALGPRTLEVRPLSPLLRVEGGTVEPVGVRLFLYAETRMQRRYNSGMRDALSAVVSHNTTLESQDRAYLVPAMTLGRDSAVDELHVLQLDEFQVPQTAWSVAGSAARPSALSSTGCEPEEIYLHQFPKDQWDSTIWESLSLDRMRRVQTKNKFFAVPLYENISLLAYNQRRIEELAARDNRIDPSTVLSTWEKLELACVAWDALQTGEPFFDCPLFSSENYNCLFFEILLSLKPLPNATAQVNIREWLADPKSSDRADAATITASRVYRRLCRAAHMRRDTSRSQPSPSLVPPGAGTSDAAATIRARPAPRARKGDTSGRAVVWRHWYSTLNQMMSSLTPDQRREIRVRSLPGGCGSPDGITTSGEWYVGIPAYSAAPDVGLRIIKLMTSPEAESDRLRLGVGMPTRQSFYSVRSNGARRTQRTRVSPYFWMEAAPLRNLITKPFRRSRLSHYSRVSGILTYHLQRIIEIPEKNDLEEQLREIFEQFWERMEFAGAAGPSTAAEQSVRYE